MFRALSISPEQRPTSAEGEQAVALPDSTAFRWIDLSKQNDSSLSILGERFGFHPLTLEDCSHFNQRPKLEVYEKYAFVVLHGFSIDWNEAGSGNALELHIFVGPNYLVTVHEQPIAAIETVWKRLLSDNHANHESGICFHLLADALIDSYFPLLDEVHVRLEDLEERVLTQPKQIELAEILAFKRLLLELRRTLSPQRDLLALLARRVDGIVSERVSFYFRDVYDHALRLYESVESARELLGNVRDAHLWNLSQRTNEVMQRLTVLSAVFLPLTFITGFFGQNFEALPFESTFWLYVMLGSVVVVPVVMLSFFIRSKWF